PGIVKVLPRWILFAKPLLWYPYLVSVINSCRCMELYLTLLPDEQRILFQTQALVQDLPCERNFLKSKDSDSLLEVEARDSFRKMMPLFPYNMLHPEYYGDTFSVVTTTFQRHGASFYLGEKWQNPTALMIRIRNTLSSDKLWREESDEKEEIQNRASVTESLAVFFHFLSSPTNVTFPGTAAAQLFPLVLPSDDVIFGTDRWD